MKRDPDLERDILLAIEAYDGESRPGYADLSDLEVPDLQVKYQVVLLHEAGLPRLTVFGHSVECERKGSLPATRLPHRGDGLVHT